jgi:hypothetical protein
MINTTTRSNKSNNQSYNVPQQCGNNHQNSEHHVNHQQREAQPVRITTNNRTRNNNRIKSPPEQRGGDEEAGAGPTHLQRANNAITTIDHQRPQRVRNERHQRGDNNDQYVGNDRFQ